MAFSGTFPATVFALRGFAPVVVGAGRTVAAAVIAVACLLLTRSPLPTRRQLAGLAQVALGCGIGFGVLSAIALGRISASHAAVVIALLPVSTAVFAVTRSGERVGRLFWLASGGGTAVVLGFALRQGSGSLSVADALLLVALVVGALGYAEGGRLSREMPGWRVISWGLVLALPVALPLTLAAVVVAPPHPGRAAVAGLAYVSAVSMFLGFVVWYRGLALVGVAQGSQLQLGQPFLTLIAAAVLLGERPGMETVLSAAAVLGCVALTQRGRGRAAAPSGSTDFTSPR